MLDPYAGSGTAVVVAARLNRPAIGIDESHEAVLITLRRLDALGIRALQERVSTARPAHTTARPDQLVMEGQIVVDGRVHRIMEAA